MPECLQLPGDRVRPAQQSYRGATLAFTLDHELTTQLKELSRRSGATLFMTLLSAWASLLGRYSGEEDLVIGSPIANRTHSAIEPLIGFFVNTLALRDGLEREAEFPRTAEACASHLPGSLCPSGSALREVGRRSPLRRVTSAGIRSLK